MTLFPRGWVIAATFVVAFMLTALPLPEWVNPWRPAWVALVLIYWCLALPEHVGLYVSFAVGLLLDAMLSAPLGQNALGLTVIGFVVVMTHQRMRLFPIGQQALLVGLLIGLYLLLNYAVRQALSLHRPPLLQLWLPAVSSALLWPWLFVLLRDLRRRAHLG